MFLKILHETTLGKQAQNAVDDAGRHPVHCRAAEQQRDDQQVDDIADH